MRKDRLRCLVDECRLVEIRLDQIRFERIKVQTSLDILQETEKDLNNELDKAKNSKDSKAIEEWQAIIDLLGKDSDSPSKEDIAKAKEKISQDQERLIVYYERKLKNIKRLLGERLSEILEGYGEKNILISGGSSESSFRRLVDKEEEDKEIQEIKENKKKINFDKM